MRDLLIYGALFLGWLLFNWIASRAKGRQRAQRAAEHARNAPDYARGVPEAARPAPPDTEWGRAPSAPPEYVPEPVRGHVPEALPELPSPASGTAWSREEELPGLANSLPQAGPEPARRPAQRARSQTQVRRPARRPRVHTQSDLRDAMVLTALLGPCRADQPWESPDRS